MFRNDKLHNNSIIIKKWLVQAKKEDRLSSFQLTQWSYSYLSFFIQLSDFKDKRTYLRASTLSGRVAAANRRSWLMERVGHGESTCRRIEERLAWNLPDELFSQLSWSTGSGIQETRKSRSSPLISVRRTLHFGTLPSLPPCLSRRRAAALSSQPLASPFRGTFSPTLAPCRATAILFDGERFRRRKDLGNF